MTIICYIGLKFSNKTGTPPPPKIRKFGISKHVVILHAAVLEVLGAAMLGQIAVGSVSSYNSYLNTRLVL
jgi:hypothetical protein